MKYKIKDIAVMSYLLSLLILPVLCFILHKQSMQLEAQRIELWHSHNRERIYASRSLFKRDVLSYYERKDSIVMEALKHNKELDSTKYIAIDKELDKFFAKEDKRRSLIYKNNKKDNCKYKNNKKDNLNHNKELDYEYNICLSVATGSIFIFDDIP